MGERPRRCAMRREAKCAPQRLAVNRLATLTRPRFYTRAAALTELGIPGGIDRRTIVTLPISKKELYQPMSCERSSRGQSWTPIHKLAPYMRGWRRYFGFCETPDVLIALIPHYESGDWSGGRPQCPRVRQARFLRQGLTASPHLPLGISPPTGLPQ